MIDGSPVLQLAGTPNKGFGLHAVIDVLPGDEKLLLGGQI